jgi:tetratricopeptide (TPR) repeat protein
MGFAGFLYWHTLILPPAQASRLVGEGVKNPDPVAATAAFAAALAIPQQYPGMVAYYYAQTALRHGGRARTLTAREIDMLEGADTALRHAVGRAAGNSRDHFLLAQLRTQLAKANPAHFTQALAAIDRALDLAPRRQELYHLKGKIQLLQGDPALALVTLRAALELEPRVAASWKALALAQYQAGLVAEAVASLRVADSLMLQASDHPGD